jgi:hypothetical protein
MNEVYPEKIMIFDFNKKFEILKIITIFFFCFTLLVQSQVHAGSKIHPATSAGYAEAAITPVPASPSAIAARETILVPGSADKRVLVPKSIVSSLWYSSLSYADSGWELCTGAPGGVGYEKNSGYENLISLDVGNDMYQSGANPNNSCYIRIRFSVTQSTLNNLGYLALKIWYDDGFIAYLNGTRVAGINAPDEPVWNSASAGDHEATSAETVVITEHVSDLHSGDNLFAIQGFNTSTASSDFIIAVELVGSESNPGSFTSSNLPIFVLDTEGQEIVDYQRIDAHMGVINNSGGERNHLTDPFNDFDGKVGIKLRGSSTLSFPKKQYAVEIRDSLDNDLNVSLLDLPKESDWILNAPYTDKSVMRNVTIYTLAREMGRYASRTRYCEMVLNGEYMGLYVLLEKIKRGKDRVDIAKLKSTDLAGDSLTGGYIVKLDKFPESNRGFYSDYLPSNGSWVQEYYQYHYPDGDAIKPEQEAYIQQVIHTFEDVMAADDYNDPQTGYNKYIKLDSFVDFFIQNEITKNVDGYRLSTFMYKDRDSKDGRLTMGPIWDFNLGFGNADYYDGWDPQGWELEYLDSGEMNLGDGWQIPFYWRKFLNDPGFQVQLYKRWFSLRRNVLSDSHVTALLDSLYTLTSEARDRNFAKWPVLGIYVWPNPVVFATYNEEFQYLKDWISNRMAWMDDAISEYESGVDEKDRIHPSVFYVSANYPNPFNPRTTINYSLPSQGSVRLTVLDLSGRMVKTLVTGMESGGEHSVIWDGSDDAGARVASGIYFYQVEFTGLQGGRKIETRKMCMVK